MLVKAWDKDVHPFQSFKWYKTGLCFITSSIYQSTRMPCLLSSDSCSWVAILVDTGMEAVVMPMTSFCWNLIEKSYKG